MKSMNMDEIQQKAERKTGEDVHSAEPRTGLIGWGYEGKSIDDLIKDCEQWGVGTVVDVRLTPWSHKQDFTKARLSNELERHGIRYLHLKALGNPKDNRAGFVSTSSKVRQIARERFIHALDNSQSQNELNYLKELSKKEYVLLLCFEKNETNCHRGVIRAMVKGINSMRRDSAVGEYVQQQLHPDKTDPKS